MRAMTAAAATALLLLMSVPSAVAHEGDAETTYGPAKTHGHTSKLADLRDATSGSENCMQMRGDGLSESTV